MPLSSNSEPVDTNKIVADFERLTGKHANEAQTRLEIIDQILFGVLGWNKSDVSVEERVSEDGTTTFADYIYRTANNSIVVEAKKVGDIELALPKEKKLSLTGNWLRGETGKAVIQARDYARKKSLPFAAATNGSYWIIFPATRTDGVSFEESNCIVYPDIRTALIDELDEFRALLGIDAINRNSLNEYLIGNARDQHIERRLNRHFDYATTPKTASPLYPFVSDAILESFSEDLIKRDADTLAKCYVKTPQRNRFDSRIQMHVARRSNVTGHKNLRALKAADEPSILEKFEAASSRTKPSAILIFGPVGAGKTTFLFHTRQVSAKHLFEPDNSHDRQHWIYLDFKEFDPEAEVQDFVTDKLMHYIERDEFLSDYERCLKYAYKEEIEALFRGPLSLLANDERFRKEKITEFLFAEYEKRTRYVDTLISYAASNRAVFVVFDNIDQIDKIERQKDIISSLLAFSTRTGSSIVIALRGTTYLKQKHSAVLDAFDYDPIQIDPPEIKPVLSARFRVARELLRGKSASFTSESGAKVEAGDIGIFVEIVRDSVLESRVSDVIDVLSGGDIRLALRMTREFLEFGYSEPSKALEAYKDGQRYILPQHEAIRAIMLGNHAVYDGEYSVIGNIFDTRRDRDSEQFLKLFVLQYLVLRASEKNEFEDVNVILDALHRIGFGEGIALSVLTQLHTERYIVTQTERPVRKEGAIMASRLGGRFLREYLTELAFLENFAMDTYISDRDVWEKLRELTVKVHAERNVVKRLRYRIQRAKTFYEYVCDRLQKVVNIARKAPLDSEWNHNFLEERHSDLERSLAPDLASAERNYGNKRRRSQ